MNAEKLLDILAEEGREIVDDPANNISSVQSLGKWLFENKQEEAQGIEFVAGYGLGALQTEGYLLNF